MDLKKIKITKQAKICLSLLIAIIMLLFIDCQKKYPRGLGYF